MSAPPQRRPRDPPGSSTAERRPITAARLAYLRDLFANGEPTANVITGRPTLRIVDTLTNEEVRALLHAYGGGL